MVDIAKGFRVLVVGRGARPAAWLDAITSHGWDAMISWGDAVRDDARTLWPHAALIDASNPDEASAAGLAVRSGGPYNAAVLLLTSDEQVRARLRSRVPAITFVTEKTYMGELWQLPAARFEA